MFTINIYLKFALIGLCLVGGTILAFTISFWYAFPFLLIGLGLLASYILLGTVQSSAEMVQSMNFVEAEKRMNLTWKPEWLYKTNRAFYYMLKSTLAMNRKDNDEAEQWLAKAQSIELPSDNEKAMVELQLASINANKGKWKAAQMHHRNLKNLNITEPQLKAQVKEFDKVISQRGTIKQATRMNRGKMPIKPGGKRRRPKMR